MRTRLRDSTNYARATTVNTVSGIVVRRTDGDLKARERSCRGVTSRVDVSFYAPHEAQGVLLCTHGVRVHG